MILRPVPLSLFLLLSFLYLQFPGILLASPSSSSSSSSILQEVLKEISESQGFDLDDIRISKLDLNKVRYGTARRHEFRVRPGKSYLLFKFPDEVSSWNKFDNNGSHALDHLLTRVPVLDNFKVEGPLDLWVAGDDQLSLLLPLNNSYSGLKRILVPKGVRVEVKGAQEISVFRSFDLGFAKNGSVNKEKNGYFPFWHSLCMPLVPVSVIGSASLLVYRTRNPAAAIETRSLSKEMIELLPEKCSSSKTYKNQRRPNDSLSSSILTRLERFLRNFFGDRTGQTGFSGFLRANLRASTIIRFQLEVEKNIGTNETLEGMAAEWRTRPAVERLWFDVTARVEGDKLKPLVVKKVRPFIAVDTASWSNLMSNISFTKFPSVLVPPEALTLDVKWQD